ncbi:MAG: LytR C-terminal domain-containing protein [Actinomycetota bacterium]|nr:LytR C-terminal domain-containing protein [Actinomycetota bacterium]
MSGRHSADNETFFYRSAALWFLPWTVVAVVALAAAWIAIDALGNEVGAPPPAREEGKKPPPKDSSPTASDDASPTPASSPSVSESPPDGDDVELITENISVQVLNGTSVDDAGDDWADRLERLGFEIGAVNPYSTRDETIVYWSSDQTRAAAEALAQKFGWDSRLKPPDLSPEVDLHVVVGQEDVDV